MVVQPKKSSTRFLEDDPYREVGIGALKNRLGIKYSPDLAEAELVLSSYRVVQGLPSGDWGWDHFKLIHKHLFKDVYEWAGNTRACHLFSDSGRSFVAPENIDRAVKMVFSELKADRSLQGVSEQDFANKASYYYSRLNAIHPFRSGNGRVIRLFLSELAKQNGYRFDWSKTNAVSWQKASIASEKDFGLGILSHIFRQVVTERDMSIAHELKNSFSEQTDKEWKAGGDVVIKAMVSAIKKDPSALDDIEPAGLDDDIALSSPSPGMG